MTNHYQNDISLIEKYLEEELNEKDRVRFELRLQEDADFRALFEAHKLLTTGIRANARASLRQQMEDWEKQMDEHHAGRGGRFRAWWYVAAGIALLIVGLGSFFWIDQDHSGNLVAEHFEPYPATYGAVQRSGDEPSGKLREAISLYEQGNYDKAIPVLQTIVEENPDPVIKFYLANAHQANQEPEQAIELYLGLLEGEKGLLQNQIMWYLSLCFIELQDYDSARVYLLRISNEENPYQMRAATILSKLE